MPNNFIKAYCKLHMEEFERGKRHGRWTFLWNEDGGWARMKRKVKQSKRGTNAM